jgi:hypothetical protein
MILRKLVLRQSPELYNTLYGSHDFIESANNSPKENQNKNYRIFLALSNLIGWAGFLVVLLEPTILFCSQALMSAIFPNILYANRLLNFDLKINALKQWIFCLGIPGLWFCWGSFFMVEQDVAQDEKLNTTNKKEESFLYSSVIFFLPLIL